MFVLVGIMYSNLPLHGTGRDSIFDNAAQWGGLEREKGEELYVVLIRAGTACISTQFQVL